MSDPRESVLDALREALATRDANTAGAAAMSAPALVAKDETGSASPDGTGANASGAADAATAAATPALATRIWNVGAAGDWYDTAQWTTAGVANSYPLPGDTAIVGSGTAVLIGYEAKNSGTFSGNFVTLGSSSASAELEFVDATVGGFFTVTTAGNAALMSDGVSVFSGAINARVQGATLTLGSFANGNQAGNLVLQQTALAIGETLAFQGNVTIEGRAAFTAPTVVNNGTVNLVGNTNSYVNTAPKAVPEPFNHVTGDVSGTGTFNLQFNSKLAIDGNVAAGQTISFDGVDAELSLANPAGFAGQVTGFGVGDQIDFSKTAFDNTETATYSATAQTLTLSNASGVLAMLHGVQAQAGALSVVADGSGEAAIGYASALPSATYALQGGDAAMRADVVRQTMTVPGTATPIDGTGVTIGIISGSFNSQGQAAANQAAGYLPSGTNLVDARDNPNGTDDEGQAMAELIHQVAPGAKIVFASDVNGVGSAAQLLQSQYHVQIIADDISEPAEPWDQLDPRTGSDDAAIQQVVNSGVNYFLASGNYGHAFYANSFAPTSTTLSDGSTVGAQVFTNGTPYELITVPGTTAGATGVTPTTILHLQWAAPIGSTSTTPLAIKVFDSSGNAVNNGNTGVDVSTMSTGGIAGANFVLPASATSTTYRVAIYEPLNATTTAPGQFEFTLERGGSGTAPGGIIDDPAAGMGPGNLTGPELIPGVNTVGAIDYSNSAAYGLAPVTNEAATSFGPGQLLYGPDGKAYASPMSAGKNDFTAPDGIDTTVTNFTPFFGSSAAAPNAAAVAALMLQANGNLTTSQVTQLLEQSAIPFGNTDQSGAGLIQADRAVAAAIALGPACYVAGTRIATVRGDVVVEALVIGDRVVTCSGEHRPIRWLGRRSYAGRFANRNCDLLPVCFKAGSLGDGMPTRDLWVSPKHAMFIDGALFPAEHLVDGIAVIKASRIDVVHYHHVELDSHDVLIAEGAPSESFVDDHNREMFGNAAEFERLFPHAKRGEAVYCAPRLEQGPRLEAVRRRIAGNAEFVRGLDSSFARSAAGAFRRT